MCVLFCIVFCSVFFLIIVSLLSILTNTTVGLVWIEFDCIIVVKMTTS